MKITQKIIREIKYLIYKLKHSKYIDRIRTNRLNKKYGWKTPEERIKKFGA